MSKNFNNGSCDIMRHLKTRQEEFKKHNDINARTKEASFETPLGSIEETSPHGNFM